MPASAHRRRRPIRVGLRRALGGLLLRDGEEFHLAAARAEPRVIGFWRGMGLFRPPEGHPMSRLIRGERFVQIADVRPDQFYRDSPAMQLLELGDVHTCAASQGRNAARCRLILSPRGAAA
jgi:hypothetical protein